MAQEGEMCFAAVFVPFCLRGKRDIWFVNQDAGVTERRRLVVGVVEEHELGYPSSEQIGALVFEELGVHSPRYIEIFTKLLAVVVEKRKPAIHSPLTNGADALATAGGSPTSPEREGHQGYGHRPSSQNDFFSKNNLETTKGKARKERQRGESSKGPEETSREEEPKPSSDGEPISERGVDLSELERMRQISDVPKLKLSPIMAVTDSTTTKKPDNSQAPSEEGIA
ncbi:hypothetical protein BKA70DRAFT_1411305 [Coprinopsis sp. MPI-PUGE-AT-0042]|nr:hypothetical protein BKA70DRAFT_1411305 [Coprinopsis sp. MPI-PUGE-AT-0042]